MRQTKSGALYPVTSEEKVAVFDAVEFYLHEQQFNPYDQGEPWRGDESSLTRIRDRLRPHVDAYYRDIGKDSSYVTEDRLLFKPEDTRLIGSVLLHTAYFHTNKLLGNYCLTLINEARADINIDSNVR